MNKNDKLYLAFMQRIIAEATADLVDMGIVTGPMFTLAKQCGDDEVLDKLGAFDKACNEIFERLKAIAVPIMKRQGIDLDAKVQEKMLQHFNLGFPTSPGSSEKN